MGDTQVGFPGCTKYTVYPPLLRYTGYTSHGWGSVSPINWARSPIIKYQQVSRRYRRKAHSNKVSEYQE